METRWSTVNRVRGTTEMARVPGAGDPMSHNIIALIGNPDNHWLLLIIIDNRLIAWKLGSPFSTLPLLMVRRGSPLSYSCWVRNYEIDVPPKTHFGLVIVWWARTFIWDLCAM